MRAVLFARAALLPLSFSVQQATIDLSLSSLAFLGRTKPRRGSRRMPFVPRVCRWRRYAIFGSAACRTASVFGRAKPHDMVR